MSALEDIIRDVIKRDGPMDVGAFMSLALSHPEHGYYMKADPFGVSKKSQGGDFVTAPEISQMFGELIGAWAADFWVQMGAPARVALVELGPGRGSLMADALRATRGVAGFHDAAQVHLVEISPVLRAAQGAALAGFDVAWHDGIGGLPDDCPVIVIANEFFDALPVRQEVCVEGGWRERLLGCAPEQGLEWNFVPEGQGDIREVSPVREAVMRELSLRLKGEGGAALIVDYGHVKSAVGDTFQAVYKHKYCDVLAHIGDADLTAHVDFDVLRRCALDVGVYVDAIVEQGAFLRSLGIEARAAYLVSKGAENAEKDLHRLIDDDAMGTLFKVMELRFGY